MASELKAQLKEQMKAAMKAKDKPRLSVIRSIQAAIKQVEIDQQTELADDAQVLPVLDKMLKQRRDSYQQYIDADRPELAETEQFEMDVIQSFLPQPLTDEEVTQMIETAVAETQAASMQDMGKVMGVLKPQMQGRADMSVVSQKLKARLNA